MTAQRAYWKIPIQDTQEFLVKIPEHQFASAPIHDYEKLGAPYDNASPYAVRDSVLKALVKAQEYLQRHHPQWRLYIFDAYRPLAVQSFMANHAYKSLLQEKGLENQKLDNELEKEIWSEVYKIWAPPNDNPLTPPPHSTGAAVDLTIFDEENQTCINMGSPIDEMSERSQPLHFQELATQTDLDPATLHHATEAAKHRHILLEAMNHAEFERHPGEWWHFCLGDQMWVWLSQEKHPERVAAQYGRYDLLNQGMA